MSVLMIAPTRLDLPNVAIEAAAVVNALGGQLLQGLVTERDVRDAASTGGFDGIWFATHTNCDRMLLAGDESLSEAALVAYVAASGAQWCFINSCQSIGFGQRIIDETQADVICTVAANPDLEAMRTGVLFARQLQLLGDTRDAYERAKPGGNRLFVYLDNYRQRIMTSMPQPAIPAQDRLQTTMDEMRREISHVASEVAVLKSEMRKVESSQDRTEDRLTQIERQLRPVPTWQTWAMLIVGLAMCLMTILLLVRING